MGSKWVLWAGGVHHWSTASDNYQQAMRLALRHFGIRDDVLYKDDKFVQNRWLAFIKDRHDGACLLQASPQRGSGKTEPNKDERKIVGWYVYDPVNIYRTDVEAMRRVIRDCTDINDEWFGDDAVRLIYRDIIANKDKDPSLRTVRVKEIQPLYEEPKSTYVTRESAERAIKAAVEAGVQVASTGKLYDLPNAYELLEDKPRERVKAGK